MKSDLVKKFKSSQQVEVKEAIRVEKCVKNILERTMVSIHDSIEKCRPMDEVVFTLDLDQEFNQKVVTQLKAELKDKGFFIIEPKIITSRYITSWGPVKTTYGDKISSLEEGFTLMENKYNEHWSLPLLSRIFRSEPDNSVSLSFKVDTDELFL